MEFLRCLRVWAVTPLALLGLLAVSGCNSFSSSCSNDACTLNISGNGRNEMPRFYDGTRNDAVTRQHDRKDSITLESATEGGEAVIKTGDTPQRCTAGSSFRVEATTITCDEVHDNSVKLTSTW